MLNFGNAIEKIKQGEKVRRKGWNGKDMYLFLVEGEGIRWILNNFIGNLKTSDDAGIEVGDAIYLKTADNKLIPWLASQSDLLAEDWIIYREI